ncbi:hypothetical protein CS022_04495 [Veronia nyctiphanis]|uniref:Uncharacterized protein n=1 Tax=Veronia nyctiphanis TaxID=1278244 RepID=A0A4Q0YU75_9GAMM|nr:hypothetical protein [Veronia nyctiphanis]RXJ74315.1 hypothetical protein CS022_04495 [Veronia nyctiphanis]
MEEKKLNPEEYFNELTQKLVEESTTAPDTKHFESAIASSENDSATLLSQIYMTLNLAKLISQVHERDEYLRIKSRAFDGVALSQSELDQLQYYDAKIKTHELDLAIRHLLPEDKVRYYRESIDFFDLEHRPGNYSLQNDEMEGITSFDSDGAKKSNRYRELYESIKNAEKKAISGIREKAMRDPDYYGRLIAFSDK